MCVSHPPYLCLLVMAHVRELLSYHPRSRGYSIVLCWRVNTDVSAQDSTDSWSQSAREKGSSKGIRVMMLFSNTYGLPLCSGTDSIVWCTLRLYGSLRDCIELPQKHFPFLAHIFSQAWYAVQWWNNQIQPCCVVTTVKQGLRIIFKRPDVAHLRIYGSNGDARQHPFVRIIDSQNSLLYFECGNGSSKHKEPAYVYAARGAPIQGVKFCRRRSALSIGRVHFSPRGLSR